jgi:hypothetical protein
LNKSELKNINLSVLGEAKAMFLELIAP